MSFVDVTVNEHVATVTLNRPERMNAISTALTEELHTRLFEVNQRDDVRAIIFTGAGRAFCAGDDLKEFEQQTESDAAIVKHIENIQRITYDLMYSDKFVVGAVHGYAVGGGFEWMLNCDVVVAADDLVAFLPELEWGQFPTGGVTHLLPQSLGHQHTMEIMVLGDRLTADDLLQRRLINWVVPHDEMLRKARTVADQAASKSPFSVARLKRLLTRGVSGNLGRSIELEQEFTVQSFKTDEAKERSKQFPTQK